MTTPSNQEIARTGDDSQRYTARVQGAAEGEARAPSAATIAWAGLWLALVTGFVEVAILGYRRYALGAFIARSRDVAWMAPLGDLLLIGVPALLLALLARRWPRLITLRLATGLIALPCALSVLLLLFYQRLHNAALLLLAVGVAVQAARWAGGHGAGFARLVRRTTPVLLALVLLLAVALPGARRWRERRALAALPAAPAGAPNVLLIILDTVRAASLSLYGAPQPTTPKLARWAARGVVFEQALATAPWTLPSHGTLFTGRYPHELSTGWQTPLDGRYPTLAERFSRHGYRTAGFVANLQYATYEHGLARGFLRYEDYPLSLPTVLLSSALGRTLINAKTPRRIIGTDEHLNRKSAAELRGDFLHWLGEGGEARPFFAFLNYYDAHEPYLPPDEYFRRFAGRDRPNRLSPLRRFELGQRRSKATAADIALEKAAYEGSIAYLDDQLDALFSELERRGVMDNTLVVVTSDHGEEFAEHGVFYHGHTLYLPALHVPLIVWMKGRVPEGRRIAQPVSLRDVAATVLDLSGARGGAEVPGASLAALWGARGDPAGAPASPVVSEVQRGIRLPDWYPAAHDDLRSIVADDRHFIDGPGGKRALFDIAADPWEQHDLSATADGRAEVERLRARLAPFVRAPGTAPAGAPMAGPE